MRFQFWLLAGLLELPRLLGAPAGRASASSLVLAEKERKGARITSTPPLAAGTKIGTMGLRSSSSPSSALPLPLPLPPPLPLPLSRSVTSSTTELGGGGTVTSVTTTTFGTGLGVFSLADHDPFSDLHVREHRRAYGEAAFAAAAAAADNNRADGEGGRRHLKDEEEYQQSHERQREEAVDNAAAITSEQREVLDEDNADSVDNEDYEEEETREGSANDMSEESNELEQEEASREVATVPLPSGKVSAQSPAAAAVVAANQSMEGTGTNRDLLDETGKNNENYEEAIEVMVLTQQTVKSSKSHDEGPKPQLDVNSQNRQSDAESFLAGANKKKMGVSGRGGNYYEQGRKGQEGQLEAIGVIHHPAAMIMNNRKSHGGSGCPAGSAKHPDEILCSRGKNSGGRDCPLGFDCVTLLDGGGQRGVCCARTTKEDMKRARVLSGARREKGDNSAGETFNANNPISSSATTTTTLLTGEKDAPSLARMLTIDDDGGEYRRAERRALEAFYKATNGDGWESGCREGWLDGDYCSWGGITCSEDKYVLGFGLPACGLQGTMPPELGELVNLKDLQLYYNELTGTIPAELGELKTLEGLLLNSNVNLTGTIPSSFGNLTELRLLSVHDTNIDPIGYAGRDYILFDNHHPHVRERERNALMTLYHKTNGAQWWHESRNYGWEVNGTETDHCQWDGVGCSYDGYVDSIDLEGSNLTGNIPTDLGSLELLEIFIVSNNGIEGSIPTEIGGLINLKKLDLSRTTIYSKIPSQMGGLARLEVLNISNTNRCVLLSTHFGSLSSLRQLDLSNSVYGFTIPSIFDNLSKLEDLRLSGDWFSGEIPPEIQKMEQLERLDLDDNMLIGGIPVEMGFLKYLRELRLSENEDLGGTIPVKLRDLQYLEVLELSNAQLTGTLPPELRDLQYLEVLELSNNQFNGMLPPELGDLSRMRRLLLDGNDFQGSIPSEYGQLSSIQNLTLGATLFVSGPTWLLKPAPLPLCFNDAFDLQLVPSWCPPERNALYRLFLATNGVGWSNNSNWADHHNDHCSWHGVNCTEVTEMVPPVPPCYDVDGWEDSNGDNCDYYKEAKNAGNDVCGREADNYRHQGHTANSACCVCQRKMTEEEYYGCSSWNETHCTRKVVAALHLNANGLSGSLPAELGLLSSLEHLRLDENALVGSLPTNLTSLFNLRVLNLTSNSLVGSFPSHILACPSLTELYLTNNEFSGSLSVNEVGARNGNDTEIVSRLEHFHVANNRLVGEISKTLDELLSLPFLRIVDLSYNSFRGSMPSFSVHSITKLFVRGNERLTVPIPSTVCHDMRVDIDLRDSPLHCPVYTFLRQLHNATNGTKWRNKWKWDTSGISNICDSWFGIECNWDNTSLVNITLKANGLQGKLPPSLCDHKAALSTLRVLDLRQNELSGPLPPDLTCLLVAEDVLLSGNNFEGNLPSRMGDRIKMLDMGKNCLSGTLPVEFGRLRSLRALTLPSNGTVGCQLKGSIPYEWGGLVSIENIDLSGNAITGSIPVELGRLDKLLQLRLHENNITGVIPFELGLLPQLTNLTLRENKLAKNTLAPLSVCALSDNVTDLANDTRFCPRDRNILKTFYHATNGGSWAKNLYWLDEYNHPCKTEKTWSGITCSDGTNRVDQIDLIGNGLFGTLPSELFQLKDLTKLKVGDNRLFGTLSANIGDATRLKMLLLAGNDFSGKVPGSIANLTHLTHLHLHDNKFSAEGDIPQLYSVRDVDMITDCGEPYFYGNLTCPQCTTCCNSEGRCTEEFAKSEDALSMLWQTCIFMVCLIVFYLILGGTAYLLRKTIHLPTQRHRPVDYCGTGSVYMLFLTNSYCSWVLAMGTVALQFFIMISFLQASEINSESSDWEYFLRCPSGNDPDNQVHCENERSVSKRGWLIFSLLLLAHLGRDIICGPMLFYTAGLRKSARCLFSGIAIGAVTGFAVWGSVQYNVAIAKTNTELIINAVIMIFVNDLDEKIFELAHWAFPVWLEQVTASAYKFSKSITGKELSKDDFPSDFEDQSINATERASKGAPTHDDLAVQIMNLIESQSRIEKNISQLNRQLAKQENARDRASNLLEMST